MPFTATAWTMVPKTTTTTTTMTRRTPQHKSKQQRFMSSISTSTDTNPTTTDDSKNNNNNNDWEYVEFDRLTESDLAGSEWLIGTCWDNRPAAIDETWCRLITNGKDGTNVAVWGDNAQGKWSLDVATQYVTVSKTRPWGKQIWACLVEDYYYMRGTVRGWSFWTAAAVEGQWQARRLGVDPEEAGVAPWFANDGDEESEGSIGRDENDDDK